MHWTPGSALESEQLKPSHNRQEVAQFGEEALLSPVSGMRYSGVSGSCLRIRRARPMPQRGEPVQHDRSQRILPRSGRTSLAWSCREPELKGGDSFSPNQSLSLSPGLCSEKLQLDALRLSHAFAVQDAPAVTARLSGVQWSSTVRAELRTELLHLVDAFLYVVYTGCILENQCPALAQHCKAESVLPRTETC